MALTPEELVKLQGEMIWASERKTKAKELAGKPTKAQRKMDQLSKNQQDTLTRLYGDVKASIDKSTYIMPKEDRTPETTKAALKKPNDGDTRSGIFGIISSRYREDVLSTSQSLVRYCVEKYTGEESENKVKINNLRDIKPWMVGEFLDDRIKSGSANKESIRTYLGHLRKLAECNVAAGIKSHKNLVNDRHAEQKSAMSYDGKTRNRYKSGQNAGETMSIAHARTIAKHAHNKGPIGGLMLDILMECGDRISELMRVKFEHFDLEEGTKSLTEKNMTKGGRPRIVYDLSPQLRDKIKDLWDTGLFQSHQNIFKSHFGSQDSVRNFVKECAAAGKVGYLGLHAFRSVAIKIEDKKQLDERKKSERRGDEAKAAHKEETIQKILKAAAADPRLNPLVPKEVRRMVHAKDDKGNLLYYKNGNSIMNVAKDSRGNTIFDKIVDPATGKYVLEPKFTYEKLKERRIDYLEHVVTMQKVGHNRTTVRAEYYG